MYDLGRWLDDMGLGDYARVFAEHAIDAEILPDLTDADLKELGIPLGHRKRLLKAIAASRPERLTETPPAAAVPGQAGPGTAQAADAERRQLTVMFCDLVDSTELSQRLDPEDLRDINCTYQDACKSAINRFEGFVARYMGDGVLAYFGYPHAHEDDAERAARAALALIEAMGGLNERAGKEHGVALSVRIGIATGPVVVGDLIGEDASQESAVVGETPNLAARLQGLAAPNTAVISSSTHDLAAGAFEYEDLGAHKLKGIAEPVHAWQVVSPSGVESRFEALHRVGLTPLVGREQEIALLLDRWTQAKQGDGQVVLLSGEPGIGKSRIVETLRQRAAPEGPIRLRYQCSPYHTSSALYPVIEQLARAAHLDESDSPPVRLDKLESMLVQSTPNVERVAPLIATLLSIPFGDRYAPLELTREQQKEETLASLVAQFRGLCHRRPVLLVFEDVHWADPTSLELLGLLVDEAQSERALVIITYRPEFTPPWTAFGHITALTLNRLSHSLGAAIIESITGGKPMPDGVCDQIVDKTDGVPLFIEELTKAVVESGLLEDKGNRYELAGPLPPLAIPATLQDSLMSRLDRLTLEKEVAQTAAVIGREFTHELISAVSTRSESELGRALEVLLAAGLVFRRGTPPRARYMFKHALVRDAAYASLLRSKRHHLHGRIADILESRFPERAQMEPELLAYHYEQAGLRENAIGYWRQAGQRASERSANVESIAHGQKGLALVEQLPGGEERDRLELGLQIMLGAAWISMRGSAAPEVVTTYSRSRELCHALGDMTQVFPATWGLWMASHYSGQIKRSRGLARELLDLAGAQSDPALALQAHHANWTTMLSTAELTTCRLHAEQGIELYDINKHRSHAAVFGGHDPGVCARNHASQTAWFLGYPEQAVERARDGKALAEELAHFYSLALSFTFTSWLHQYRREPDLARARAEEGIRVCEEGGVAPHYIGSGIIVAGWAMAADGDPEKGIKEIQRGLDYWRATGAELRQSHFLGILAEAYLWSGRIEEGLSTIAEALEYVNSCGEQRWAAEIYRLKGELLLSQSAANRAEAEACLQKAIRLARRQEAKSLELRAATSLSRLWSSQGKPMEARDVLAPVYNWFGEGLETPDLKDARALLDMCV